MFLKPVPSHTGFKNIFILGYVKWRQFCNLETNGISRAKFGDLKDKSFQFSSVTLPNNNKPGQKKIERINECYKSIKVVDKDYF